MKLAIMQPYFLPYIGYFQLINMVDKFVIYDDVNYIKKGWINRNNIIVNKQKQLFTISLAGASQNKLINEIEIADDFKKFIKTIQLNYSKATYYVSTFELIHKMISCQDYNLNLFIKNSLEIILDYLGINTEILFASDLNKSNELKGQQKIMAICKELNATTYLNPIGGIELYDREYFKKNNIDLFFIKTSCQEYNQFTSEFEPCLSIIDILMHNSIDETRQMMQNFVLV